MSQQHSTIQKLKMSRSQTRNSIVTLKAKFERDLAEKEARLIMLDQEIQELEQGE